MQDNVFYARPRSSLYNFLTTVTLGKHEGKLDKNRNESLYHITAPDSVGEGSCCVDDALGTDPELLASDLVTTGRPAHLSTLVLPTSQQFISLSIKPYNQ